MRLANWSQNRNVRATDTVTIVAFFQPNLTKRNTATMTYIGIHIGMFEKNCIIGSVFGECQLFMANVTCWSSSCISCQVILFVKCFP